MAWSRPLAALGAAALIGGCTPAAQEAEEVEGAEAVDPRTDENVLVAVVAGEPDLLDPHLTTASPAFQVLENVYDTLVQPGPADEPTEFEPALATGWEVSDDELTWTFELRENVVWHDGDPFDAEDVVYSFERIMDPDEGAANAWRFATVEAVRAPDERTVEIALSQPTPNLLANIGGFKGTAIVKRENVEDGSIDVAPVGTGPFRFVDYTPGESITLAAHDDYWGDGPHLTGVEFRPVADPTVALTNLQTGEVHWSDNLPPQDVADLLDDDELVVESTTGNDYWYVALNHGREPFDDRDVRRALAFAIDRPAVTQAALFDAARVNQLAIPEGSEWYHEHEPFTYDPGRARDLLAEAGVEGLQVDFMLTNEYEETIQAAQVIATQWGEVGVEAELRILDFAGWLDDQGQGNFDAFMLGWLGNIDPHDYYYAQHHSEGEFNFHGYGNPDVDELLDEAAVETDEDARKSLYDEAAELIAEDASYLFLYNPEVVQGWLPSVEGYELRADQAVRFGQVRLESEEGS